MAAALCCFCFDVLLQPLLVLPFKTRVLFCSCCSWHNAPALYHPPPPHTHNSLPTRVCDPANAPCVAAIQLSAVRQTGVQISGCGVTSGTTVYTGKPCGPGNAYVQWTSFSLVDSRGSVSLAFAFYQTEPDFCFPDD